jgi:hypothetical protein
MSVVTLRPSGDATTTGWTVTGGTGTHASAIVDDPDSNDGDTSYVLSPNVVSGTMFVELDDVPADFDPDAINSITIKVAHRRLNTPNMAVDLGTVNARLTRADETTAISTTPLAISSPIQAGYALTSFVPDPAGTHTVAEWNGARLALVFGHTNSQAADSVNQIRITAAEVTIDYTPAAAGEEEALTGVAATGAIGAFGVAVVIALSGVSGTGSVGSMSVSVSAPLAGVEATAAVGTLSPSAGFNVALSGVGGTGSVGSMAASVAAGLSGVAGTGAVGTLSPTAESGAALSGVEGAGTAGSMAVAVSAALGGVEGTGAAGDLTPAAGFNVALSGVEGTGALGSVAAAASIELSGVQAAGAVGTLAPAVGNTVALTGIQGTGAAGSTEAVVSVALVGQEAVGEVGALSPQIAAALTGEQAAGAVGTLTPIGGPVVSLTGVQGTGAVGSLTAIAVNRDTRTKVQFERDLDARVLDFPPLSDDGLDF